MRLADEIEQEMIDDLSVLNIEELAEKSHAETVDFATRGRGRRW